MRTKARKMNSNLSNTTANGAKVTAAKRFL